MLCCRGSPGVMCVQLARNGPARSTCILLVLAVLLLNAATAQKRPWANTGIHWQEEDAKSHTAAPRPTRNVVFMEQRIDHFSVPECVTQSIGLSSNTGDSLVAPCLVISVGCDPTTSFEQDVLGNTPCKVATFDCTADITPSHSRYQFYKRCVTSCLHVADNALLASWAQALELLGNSRPRIDFSMRGVPSTKGPPLYLLILTCRIALLKVGGGYAQGHEFEIILGLLRHKEAPEKIVIEASPHVASEAPEQAGIEWHLRPKRAHMALPAAFLARFGYTITSRCHVPVSNSTRTLLTRDTSIHQNTHRYRPSHIQQPELQHSAAEPFMHNAASVAPLVGHYQCFGRPKAVREVLQRFRQHYPAAPVFMVNDGGDHGLIDIAAEFQANYTYAEHTGSEGNTLLVGPDMVIAWVQRIINSAANADWVILLEDDVHLQKPISLWQLTHDINGDNQDTSLPDAVLSIIERLRGYPIDDMHYGGGGGAIFRGSFLRRMATQGKWQQHVRELATVYTVVVPSDQMLSALVYASGGTIGSYPGFVEKWHRNYSLRIAAGDVEVVHQEKGWYRKLFQKAHVTTP